MKRNFCFGLLLLTTVLASAQIKGNPDIPEITDNELVLPLIAGHRGGYDTILPENSISLFKYTIRNCCSRQIIIELDVRKSLSGSLFIMHDSTIDRTTTGSGEIKDLTDEYLLSVKLKDRKGNITDERVPLFAEVLSSLKGSKAMLMLDVKEEIWPEVVKLVRQMQMEQKCIALTFNPANTCLLNDLECGMFISALVTNQKELESVVETHSPLDKQIAYISSQTPKIVLDELKQKGILLMTDMNEGGRNKGNPYDPAFYQKTINSNSLSILITDFPVFVNAIYCQ